jgi:hypothetical protein
MQQWNATCRLCRLHHERRTRIPLERPKFCPGTPVRELTEPATRATKASDDDSTPPVAETANGAI